MQQRLQRRGTLGIAADEGVKCIAVRQVQPTLAGQQKLAAHRGHGIKHLHGMAGCGQRFGGHQAGRAAAHDGDEISLLGHRSIVVAGPRQALYAKPCA